MTTPIPFGQALAFAERTLSVVLRKHLGERQIKPETWYALQLIATRGPGLSREELSRVLASSPTMTPDSTGELLARLETEGLIHGDAIVDLTPAGADFHADLREYVGVPTARLLGEFDADDIATTIRTLQAITARAAEDLAVADRI
jgi:hypothetical protein